MRNLRMAATVLVRECLSGGSFPGGIATDIGKSVSFPSEISMDQKRDGALRGSDSVANPHSDNQVLNGPSWAWL